MVGNSTDLARRMTELYKISYVQSLIYFFINDRIDIQDLVVIYFAMIYSFFEFIDSIILPTSKTVNEIIPEKMSPVINEKFRAVSETTLFIAAFCSEVISLPVKNPSWLRSNPFKHHWE